MHFPNNDLHRWNIAKKFRKTFKNVCQTSGNACWASWLKKNTFCLKLFQRRLHLRYWSLELKYELDVNQFFDSDAFFKETAAFCHYGLMRLTYYNHLTHLESSNNFYSRQISNFHHYLHDNLKLSLLYLLHHSFKLSVII